MAEEIVVTAVNSPRNLASPFLGLEERLRTRKNPQGSIALIQSNLQGNVDATHSMIHKLIIPPEAKKIQHARIWVYGEKYRAHSTGSESQAPDTVTSTTTIPPSVTSGPSSKSTNDATTPDTVTSGISNPNTSSAESAHTHTLRIQGQGYTPDHPTKYNPSDQKIWCLGDSGTVVTNTESTHIHNVDHSHTCPGAGHLHGMDHTHNCPGSSHFHDVQMIPHTHDLVFGIYEPATATANIALKIIDPENIEFDLGSMGSGEFSKEDYEVTEYFQKPGVYSIKFEADALGRVRSIVFAQIFVEPD